MKFQKLLSALMIISLTIAVICGFFTITFLLTNHQELWYNIPNGYVLGIALLTGIALILQCLWKKRMIDGEPEPEPEGEEQ